MDNPLRGPETGRWTDPAERRASVPYVDMSVLLVTVCAVGNLPIGPQVGLDVEVRRSAKRRRTVSAYRDGERIVVLIPARFTRAEESEWVDKMVARVATPPRGTRHGDAALARRARELSAQFLDGRAVPASVRWVAPMRTRWASCTPADATIRLSRRLQDLPSWVQDYVLLHELAHLLEPGHGPRFWRLVERYPRTERARGYLDGVSAAANLPISDDLAGDVAGDLADGERFA